jgi:homoserine kinase
VTPKKAAARKRGVRVTVPASSANLGPGFDVLGLALDLVNTFDVWETDDELRVEVTGEGAGSVPADTTNLFFLTMQTYFSLAGYESKRLLIREQNRIPLARGLGSSAATIVGALLAARFLCSYEMDDERIVDMAASLEGHADNTTAAFYGGLQLAVPGEGGRLTVRRLAWPPRLAASLFVPDLLVSTQSAREVLPQDYSRTDVVRNLGRLGLLLSALQEDRVEDLGLATEDRIHQPYRAALVPGLAEILSAAREAGASGAFLSGAGPSVVALHDRHVKGLGEDIAEAMKGAATGFGLGGRAMVLDIRTSGAQFAPLPPDPTRVPRVT